VQRDHDKSNPTDRGGFSNQITSLVVINGVIVLALIVLALSSPSASEWISAAAQAEFVGSDTVPTFPTQIAQPLRPTRIVRSN
jgi:hypothetical protein